MQYPIIDSITKAYQINEWTGLNIIPLSDNLFNGNNNELFPLFIPKDTSVTVSCKNTSYAQIQYFNANKEQIDYWGLNLSGDRKYRTFSLLQDAYYFKFVLTEGIDMMITTNGNYSDYIPYSAKNNLNNKLRKTMSHCYPLYEPLQRAAAGTQTADDTEILQHYLTPLGIGGI